MVWTSPVARLWCAGQRKSAAAHTQFTHPLFAPLNTPFFTINCIKHFHTLLFLFLWLLHHEPPRLPDCSRHFLWIQQIIQPFLYDCIKYPDTFCKCFSDASIVSISVLLFSGQLLRWTKKLILLSFFLVPMVINKIYKITYLAYMAHWGAYLSAWNIVKWGIPETILQNAVQTHWS